MKLKKKLPINFQYLATITGSLSTLSLGMVFGWPSPSLSQLLREDSPIPVTSDFGSWIASMPALGGIFGALIGGFLADKIGRKKSLLLFSPIYFVSWILVAFSNTAYHLIVARFLSGISDGVVLTVLPIYLAEIADPNIRGFLGSFISTTALFGILLVNLIGNHLDIKTTALIASAIPVLHFILFQSMPESPYYLIMKNRLEEARNSIEIFTGSTDNASNQLQTLSKSVKEDLDNTSTLWDLFRIRSNRKSLFIIAGLRGAQQLTGTSAIIFYIKIIVDEAEFYDLSSNWTVIFYFGLQLIVSVISSILTDKLGRRPLLIISTTGCGFFLTLEGLYFYSSFLKTFKYLSVISLLGYIIIFSVGMSTIPMLMVGEFFPTSVKALALCLADIYFGVLVIVVSKFFQAVRDEFGIHVPFFAFAFASFLSVVFVILFVPETKGKTLEEIQEEMKGDTGTLRV